MSQSAIFCFLIFSLVSQNSFADGLTMSPFVFNDDILLTPSGLTIVNNRNSYQYDIDPKASYVEKKGKYRLDIKKRKQKIKRVTVASINSKSSVEPWVAELGSLKTTTYISANTSTFENGNELTSITLCSTIDESVLIVESKKHTCFTVTPAVCSALAKDIPQIKKELKKLVECKKIVNRNSKFLREAKKSNFMRTEKENQKAIEAQINKVSPGRSDHTNFFGILDSFTSANNSPEGSNPQKMTLLMTMLTFRRLCLSYAKFFPKINTIPSVRSKKTSAIK